jgi:hypothetical protein
MHLVFLNGSDWQNAVTKGSEEPSASAAGRSLH